MQKRQESSVRGEPEVVEPFLECGKLFVLLAPHLR
jgi:hypothetical protein